MRTRKDEWPDSRAIIRLENKTSLSHYLVPCITVSELHLSALLQVYQVLLDSRFEPPAGQPAESGDGCGGRCATLDVQWSFSAEKTALDVCEWRVSRLRLGESEFTVKEGVGTEEGLAGWHTGSNATELRGGCRYRNVPKIVFAESICRPGNWIRTFRHVVGVVLPRVLMSDTVSTNGPCFPSREIEHRMCVFCRGSDRCCSTHFLTHETIVRCCWYTLGTCFAAGFDFDATGGARATSLKCSSDLEAADG